MRLKDTGNGYGWVSIALHWITAGVVLTLWFIGNSSQAAEGDAYEGLVRLHVSIAAMAYILLWLRVVWRFGYGHPGPGPKQGRFFFTVGKYVHYSMLLAIGLMLVSGPAMVWASGNPITVFDWFAIPSPMATDFELRDTLHRLHKLGAGVIIIGTALHLAGVFKHAAFNQDGTFDKMMIAAKAPSAAGETET